MSTAKQTVIGIDVGGARKGYHAVAICNGIFAYKKADPDPAAIVRWCLNHNAAVVAVDAPCRWSLSGSSRQAEQELALYGKKIYCFATPTRKKAKDSRSNFYGWVFNGERLYECLAAHRYPLFDGCRSGRQMCVETFPHAIVCFMKGRVTQAGPKSTVRREALRERGYSMDGLSNIDFVDAALCAVTAEEFLKGHYRKFGDSEEGFIIVPAPLSRNQGDKPQNLLEK
mgnify:FL=1